MQFVLAGENAAIALGCTPKADQTSVPRPPWRGGLGTLSNEPWSGSFVVRMRSDLKQKLRSWKWSCFWHKNAFIGMQIILQYWKAPVAGMFLNTEVTCRLENNLIIFFMALFCYTFTNQHRLLKSAKDASMLHHEACLGELTRLFCQTDSYMW